MKISKFLGGKRLDVLETKKAIRIHIGEKEFDIEEEHGSLRVTKIYGCDNDKDMSVEPRVSNCVRIS